MRRKYKIAAIILVLIASSILAYGLILGVPPTFDAPILEFPVLEWNGITHLAAYRTPNWGGPAVYHNGIDLVVSQNVTIVSPVKGTVSGISESINPYAGNTLFDITIKMNWGWEVHLVLEPGFKDNTNNTLQHNSMHVTLFQRVNVGDPIATLLYSENYPHLHYMLVQFFSDVCPFTYSSSTAKTIFQTIATNTNSTICYP
nr:hypothetical protein [Candidatus Njordarchaeota archaeon]